MIKDETVKYWGFCYRCYGLFKTSSVAHQDRYAQCPHCHSKTDNWNEDVEVVKQNIKRIAMCPKCFHIWFLKRQRQVKNKKQLYAKCPSCYASYKRQKFFTYFKHIYWSNEYEKLVKDIKKRFPHGYTRILANHLTKKQFDERIRAKMFPTYHDTDTLH